MAEQPYTRAQRAAIRRINAELGGDPPHSRLTGILLAAAIIGVLCVLFVFPMGPGERAYGRVEGISFDETEEGTRLLARVQTGDQHGLVSVPAHAMCAVGDRIELVRRRTLLHVRYKMDVRGCTRVR